MPKLIRNTYAGWVSSNPVLALEDTGFERDTGRSKIGDGVKAWNDLNYFNEASTGPAGRSSIDPVEFGDPVTTKLRYEIIPGGGFTESFFDNFTTDTLSDVSRYPFGARAYSVVGGKLIKGATGLLETAAKIFDGQVTVKPITGGSLGLFPALRRVADGNFIMNYGDALWKNEGGAFTNLGNWGTTRMAGDYVLLLIEGNNVTRQVWTGDPKLAASGLRNSATIVLAGANAASYGQGVEKYGAIWGDSGTGVEGDDVRVELKNAAEVRRLMADIDKPTGGVTSTEIARS